MGNQYTTQHLFLTYNTQEVFKLTGMEHENMSRYNMCNVAALTNWNQWQTFLRFLLLKMNKCPTYLFVSCIIF